MLISPPWYRMFGESETITPLGICYIAGVLERDGIDVSIYNPDITFSTGEITDTGRIPKFKQYMDILNDLGHPLWKEIEARISREAPDIVGITVMTSKYGSALDVSRLVKKLDPHIPVVWGGIHPTLMPEDCLKHPEVDIVARGEGEYSFLELVRNLDKLDRIMGISYKADSKIIHNPVRPLIPNLDELPLPAKHLILDNEKMPSEAFGNIFASRGCPYKCIFCGAHLMWSRRVRYRSPDKVVEEIRDVQSKFHTSYFGLDDDTFSLNKKFVEELCTQLIKQRLNINWRCNTRADAVTDDIIKKMKRAGCDSINMGVEVGTDEAMTRLKRGLNMQQIREANRILRANGILLEAGFMIGFPWETKEDIQKTADFMKELDPFLPSAAIVTPYPGTELYDMAVSEGIIPANPDWSTFFPQRVGGYLTKHIPAEEAPAFFEQIERLFVEHTRKKKRGIFFSHPLYALRRIRGAGFFNLKGLYTLLRTYLWSHATK